MDAPGHNAILDLVRTAAPRGEVVDLPLLKDHLRVTGSTEFDLTIARNLEAAVSDLDGPLGYLGRCLLEQSFTLYLERFPHAGWHYREGWHWRELPLPLPPLLAVDSIGYLDATGAQQTLDPSLYVDITGPRASVKLRPGNDWPATDGSPRAVQIAFRCGYAPKNEAGVSNGLDVPAGIRQALMLMVGDYFENREAVVVAESRVTQILNPTADNLLRKHCASWL